jgi:carbonic anhydrase
MRDDKGALLFPECAGAAQSPIDLPTAPPAAAAGTAGAAAARALDLSLPAAPLRLASQHTGFGGAVFYPLQESNVTWRLGGETLHLLQFHFHGRSEHTLGGRALAMELHLVFFKHGEASPRAVLGILYGAAPAPNAALEGLWAHLHRSEHHTHDNKLPVAGLLHLRALLADTQQRYYRYAGSLTTPPCSEGVDWHVLVSSVGVSEAQRAAFEESLPGTDMNNYRDVQPLGSRVVEVLDKSQDHFIEEIRSSAE